MGWPRCAREHESACLSTNLDILDILDLLDGCDDAACSSACFIASSLCAAHSSNPLGPSRRPEAAARPENKGGVHNVAPACARRGAMQLRAPGGSTRFHTREKISRSSWKGEGRGCEGEGGVDAAATATAALLKRCCCTAGTCSSSIRYGSARRPSLPAGRD